MTKDSMSGWLRLPLKRIAVCLDHLRVPIPEWERAERPGEIPYWGSNSVQGYVDEALVYGPTVLLGEDGAPFFDRDKDVAFFVDEPIWPNNHVHVLKTVGDVSPKWLTYALNSVDYSLWIKGSTRDKLTQQAMMSIELQVPPVGEQSAIADFLDRETAQIDAMVDAQERLVALLRERRSAVIEGTLWTEAHSDCAHGSDVLFRCSRSIRLKHCLSRNDGGAWGSEPIGDGSDTVVLRSTEQTVNGGWKITDPAIRALSRAEAQASRLEYGDLVITKSSGSARHIGKTTIVEMDVAKLEASFSNFMQRISTRHDRLVPRFAWYLLNSAPARRQFDLLATSTTGLANLNGTIIGEVIIPLRPVDEQRALIGQLDEVTGQVGAMIAKAQESIALMKERRAALISAAVTGRIDVSAGTGHAERELEEAMA